MSKYPFKRLFNIVLGFDTVRKKVKFFVFDKLDFANAEMQEFSYTQQFMSDKFMEEFKQICNTFAQALPSNRQTGCYLSLPNAMVTMDSVTLPQMRREKLNSALQLHLQNYYKNYNDLRFNRYTISSNKKNTTFYLTIIRKLFLKNLYCALSENRLYSQGTTFVGNCIINSVLQFKPNYHKKNFIFLDMHESYTNVSVCMMGRTAGFCTLPFGTDRLAGGKVQIEDAPYQPTDAKEDIYENFREFVKWAYLYRKQLQTQEYLPPIDCVLVNLPKEYGFVIDLTNTEKGEEKLPFEYFDLSEKEMIANNLDMIGALYCGVYNKQASF